MSQVGSVSSSGGPGSGAIFTINTIGPDGSGNFTIESLDSSVTITPETNGINLAVAAGGGLSLGAFGSTPNADGLSLTSGVLNMQPADGTHPGGVSTTTQTMAGAKTFSTSVSSPEYFLTGSGSGTISILPQAAAGTYNFNLPITAGTSGYFLTSAGGGSSPMTWTDPATVSGVLTITGNSGGAESPSAGNFNFSGGTTGLTFAGTSATETLTGTLVLANGGTSASLTASNGGIFYSTASAGAILSGTATANQVLLSGSSTTPAWSTATYPATTTVNQLLYSSSSNVIAGITAGANGVLISSNSNVPSWLANGTAGYVLTAQSGAPPAWAAASGGGITTIDGDSGSITGTTVHLLAGSTAGHSVNFAGSSATMTLNVSDGNNCTWIGSGAGSSSITTGKDCTSLGVNTQTAITSGQYCTAVGFQSMQSCTSGTHNTSFGGLALQQVVTGQGNTAIGMQCMSGGFDGSFNAGLGYQAGVNYNATETSNIIINSPGVAAESNTLHIGAGTGTGTQQLNSAFICGIQGITVTGTAVLVSSSDQLGIAVSSRKYKENIEDMGSYSSAILDLRPVTFTLKGHEDQTVQSGLIAEEVNEIFPDIIVYDKNGDPQTVQYHNLPSLLLNELQKAIKRIEVLEGLLSK